MFFLSLFALWTLFEEKKAYLKFATMTIVRVKFHEKKIDKEDERAKGQSSTTTRPQQLPNFQRLDNVWDDKIAGGRRKRNKMTAKKCQDPFCCEIKMSQLDSLCVPLSQEKEEATRKNSSHKNWISATILVEESGKNALASEEPKLRPADRRPKTSRGAKTDVRFISIIGAEN